MEKIKAFLRKSKAKCSEILCKAKSAAAAALQNAKAKCLDVHSRAKTAVAAVFIAGQLSLTSFAATGDNVAITSEMLEPILQGAKDNLAVVIPVGIGLMAIVMGIGFVVFILKKFKKG